MNPSPIFSAARQVCPEIDFSFISLHRNMIEAEGNGKETPQENIEHSKLAFPKFDFPKLSWATFRQKLIPSCYATKEYLTLKKNL